MGTDSKWTRLGLAVLSFALLYTASPSVASAAPQHSQKKSKKQQPQLPPLPSGPTGPMQQIPLDSIAAVPPQVTYQDNQLTIVAPNSTLAEILRAVHKQTGAEIEIPPAPERVVTRLGPGPARDVLAELLNGSRFNYVLLGSEGNDSALTRIVLVAKTGGEPAPEQQAQNTPPTARSMRGVPPPSAEQQAEEPPQEDMQEAESADDNGNADENGDQQPNEAEQQQGAPPQEQPGVKTPQQMLQEMQQRQLQLQQQQPPGQPPVPGSGMPPHPPQEN